MILRAAGEKIRDLASGFPAVVVTGPRQSGKTTLVKHLFPDKPYLLLEDPDTRRFAEEDPRSFLAQYHLHSRRLITRQAVPPLDHNTTVLAFQRSLPL